MRSANRTYLPAFYVIGGTFAHSEGRPKVSSATPQVRLPVLVYSGSSREVRTPVSALKGPCRDQLDYGAIEMEPFGDNCFWKGNLLMESV